jgi:SAM-dependent methyltransferase
MSEENRKTLATYDMAAQKYLDNSKAHDALNPEKTKRKRAKLEKNLERCFSTLPEGARILEAGAADGDNSIFLKSLGYDVIATDVAPAFIEALKARGLNTQKFNLLEDDFPDNLYGVLSWRVFVHFTHADIELALSRVYDALEVGGRFVFNVIDIATHDVPEQWVDFSDEYKMGAERFYAYYTEEEILDIVAQTKFKIAESWHEEGGHNNWFVFVLEK